MLHRPPPPGRSSASPGAYFDEPHFIPSTIATTATADLGGFFTHEEPTHRREPIADGLERLAAERAAKPSAEEFKVQCAQLAQLSSRRPSAFSSTADRDRQTSTTGADLRTKFTKTLARITSLDEKENSVERPPPPTASQLLLFKGKERERQKVRLAMIVGGAEAGSVAAFDGCSRGGMMQRKKDGKSWRVVSHTCGARLCPRCARMRRHNYAQSLEEVIGEVKPNEWRFITLTMRSTDETLSDQLDHLTASFRRLRQQAIWKRNVIRAKAAIECTWSEGRQQWHPHLHIVAEGRFISQAKLSLAWEKASGGSQICDIRALQDTGKAVRYLCKYLGKAPELEGTRHPIVLLAEFYDATRARKLLLHTGKWPDIEDPEMPPADSAEDDEWENVGTIEELFTRARAGDEVARGILRAYDAQRHVTEQAEDIRDG